ncbi:hypothetical protein ABQE23_02290 [Enterococcus avium]|uniref:hypothetical protein n=1 Tax=Enterococcus avium TaxID=33945 RepID=UPI0032E4526F
MLHQAINILKEQTGIETIETDWGFESVTAEREELDPAIIQLSNTKLPALLISSKSATSKPSHPLNVNVRKEWILGDIDGLFQVD